MRKFFTYPRRFCFWANVPILLFRISYELLHALLANGFWDISRRGPCKRKPNFKNSLLVYWEAEICYIPNSGASRNIWKHEFTWLTEYQKPTRERVLLITLHLGKAPIRTVWADGVGTFKNVLLKKGKYYIFVTLPIVSNNKVLSTEIFSNF